MTVLLLETGGQTGAPSETLPTGPDEFVRAMPSSERLARTTVLISLPGDEVLVLPTVDGHVLPRCPDKIDLRRHILAAAGASRIERQRTERRTRLLDWLMVYVDEVQDAETPVEVCRALCQYGPLAIEAHTALVYLREFTADGQHWRPIVGRNAPAVPPPLSAAAASRVSGAGVTSVLESRRERSHQRVLSPVFDAFGATQIFHAHVGSAVFLLVERRHDRIFTADVRDVLQWMLEQARRALRRFPDHAP